ncbi:MAG TPA: YjbQ family protein, partial [Actinobacteria bacterium]|nr:YjbQ family protein [Actinomycetota bacterium]
MDSVVVTVETGRRRGVFDLTDDVAAFVADKGDGLVNVFAAHATCGIALVELGAGSDLDLMDRIDAILPR